MRRHSPLGRRLLAAGIVTAALVAAPTASAATAPTAVTGSASAVTANSATLNGTVNPNGSGTTWFFEYGTTTGYGTQTAVKNAGGGTSDVAVSAPVKNLTKGTTYHFRLVAKNAGGTTQGADATFVPSGAPTVTTKAATNVTDTAAKLNGTVNPNGQATTTYFEYGTTTSYGTKTPVKTAGAGTKTADISEAVAGLKPGTVYHYRLVATNAAGTGTGGDQTFATLGSPIVVTSPATGIGASTATLNGSVNPNGHATNWYFEYGTTTAYGTKTASTSAGSGQATKAVKVPLTGLTPGTTYHYRLVATSNAGTGTGADVVFTTTGPAVTISTAAGTVVFGHGVTLSGAIASKQPNQQVVVFSERFGAISFVSIATVLSGTNGAWSLVVRPSIHTAYKATWNGNTSSTLAIGVRPAVSLRVLTGARFKTGVAPSARFHGRVVQLQRRRANGTWVTIARKTLGRFSTAVFHPTLPHGRSTLRVAISINQAGAGYLAGFSRSVTFRRA
jgi:phosphodiesterase/alkaline phosphatase D-like protein